jgi:hypothetical protein
VTPKSAQITIDDQPFKGDGKLEGLSTGEHKIVVAAMGHIPEVRKINAKKGETIKIEVTLRKGTAPPPSTSGTADTAPPPPPTASAPGTLRINSKGGFCSNVTVNGQAAGATPTQVSTKPGPASITCRTADGRTIGSGANVESGKTSAVTIVIPPK